MRAEFGHPDVAILLTCFSYCYAGLTSSQVVLCLDRLLKMDDPRQEYARWVGADGARVPAEIRDLSGVNLEDAALVEGKLVPAFSFNCSRLSTFAVQRPQSPTVTKTLSFFLRADTSIEQFP